MKLFGTMDIKNNELTIGGVKASVLTKEYNTPLYVMDETLVRENCRRYYKALNCESTFNRVAYAGKSFLNIAMCNILNEENMYLDVVSGGELYTAYKAGFPLERIYFHGNNKTDYEIDLGVRLGVGRFIVDNLHELEILNSLAKANKRVQKIYLRITPGIEAHTHDYIKTGQLDSKFGFPIIDNVIIKTVKKVLELPYIELVGLHCHIGSQIFEPEPYEDAAEIMMNLIKDIYKETNYLITELDLGGGFGIYYTENDSPSTLEKYCETIINKINDTARKINIPVPLVVVEPGRSIVGNAGITLYTIGSIKEIPNIKKYVAVDGGMSDNIRPALYNSQYECVVANRMYEDELEIVTIVGKCCESGDILLNNVVLPKVYSGDILAFLTTGAYGYSMANNYNRIPKAAVVMVNNGVSRLICRRESYEDMLKNEYV